MSKAGLAKPALKPSSSLRRVHNGKEKFSAFLSVWIDCSVLGVPLLDNGDKSSSFLKILWLDITSNSKDLRTVKVSSHRTGLQCPELCYRLNGLRVLLSAKRMRVEAKHRKPCWMIESLSRWSRQNYALNLSFANSLFAINLTLLRTTDNGFLRKVILFTNDFIRI